MRILLLVSILYCCAGGAWGADEILLKNGTIVRGQIISEDAKSVTVNLNPRSTTKDKYLRMTFQKKRIRRITRGRGSPQPVPAAREEKDPRVKIVDEATQAIDLDPEEETRKRTEPDKDKGVGEKKAKADSEQKKPKKYRGPKIIKKLDPALLLQIETLAASLATRDDAARQKTENRLLLLGADTAPTLAKTALSRYRPQRLAAMRVLGKLGSGAKTSVLALLKQFALPGQKERVSLRECRTAVRKITGQTFAFQADKITNRRIKYQRRWLEWFATVEVSYPQQSGFEIPKKDWEDAAKKVAAIYKKNGKIPFPVQWMTKGKK